MSNFWRLFFMFLWAKIEKNVWNSRLKAENLQNFWDHMNNIIKQWKARTIFGETICFFNLFLEGFSYLID